MAIKLTFLLLGMMLVSPTLYAAPAPVPDDSSEEINLDAFVERLKIVLLTVQEFKDLYGEIMTLGPKIIKDVLNDPEVKAVDNDAMKELAKKLNDYLEKYEALKESDRKAQVFELVEEYDDLITNFDSNQHPELSPEAAIIEKSLERNGLGEIRKTINIHFENFLKKFEAEVDDYLSKLGEEEKKDDQEFIEWYEKVKNAKDVDEQISLFDDFFEIDEDDDSKVKAK